MELFEESERVKIRFLAAFDRLYERGLLTPQERDEVVELLDTLDERGTDELAQILADLRRRVAQRTGEA